MSRPKGSKNKKLKPPRKTIAVRLTKQEVATLRMVHKSPSKAIHALIAARAAAATKEQGK
jgi:hypothetical protein